MDNIDWTYTPDPLTPEGIRVALTQMAEEVYEVNVANGWFVEERTFGDDIALAHTEISEEFEAVRDGLTGRWLSWKVPTTISVPSGQNQAWTFVEHKVVVRFEDGSPEAAMMVEQYGPGKPEGIGSEAADQLIRLLDHCKRHGIDLGREYIEKLAYNRTRGYKHGGKAL